MPSNANSSSKCVVEIASSQTEVETEKLLKNVISNRSLETKIDPETKIMKFCLNGLRTDTEPFREPR